ncbi:MAG: CBS domain-containing protein [Thermoproteus sp.]
MDVLSTPLAEVATKNVVTIGEREKVIDALRKMVELDIRRLPIVKDRSLIGIITALDILDAIYSLVESGNKSLYGDVYMRPAVEFATRNVITARPDMTVGEAISLFLKHNFGSMPIVDEGGELMGIFTEWDAMKIVAQAGFPHQVRDVMTRIVYVLTKYSTVMDALEGITVYRFRRYPIVDERGKVISMLHVKDALRYLADEGTLNKAREGDVDEIVNEYAINIAKSPIFLTSPDDYVTDVVRKMLEYDVGGVPVVDRESGNVIGMVTEKTLLLLFA